MKIYAELLSEALGKLPTEVTHCDNTVSIDFKDLVNLNLKGENADFSHFSSDFAGL